MNSEHKMNINVYIEGDKIVVQRNSLKLSLNLSQSQTLVEQLNHATQMLTVLENQKKSTIRNFTERLLQLSKNSKEKEVFEQIQQWNNRVFDRPKVSVLAHCFSLDSNGWAIPKMTLRKKPLRTIPERPDAPIGPHGGP